MLRIVLSVVICFCFAFFPFTLDDGHDPGANSIRSDGSAGLETKSGGIEDTGIDERWSMQNIVRRHAEGNTATKAIPSTSLNITEHSTLLTASSYVALRPSSPVIVSDTIQSDTSIPVTFFQTLTNTLTIDGVPSVTKVVVTTVTTLFDPTTFSRATGIPPTSYTVSASSVFANSMGALSDDTMYDTTDISVSKLSSMTATSSQMSAHNANASGSPTPELTASDPMSGLALPPTTETGTSNFNLCGNSLLPQWCVYPTPTASSNELGTSPSILHPVSFCACPYCLMGPALCALDFPVQTTSCPDGWVCSLYIPYPTSTAWYSVPSGLEWQSEASPWPLYSETLSHRQQSSTTGVTWSAALSTSTHQGDDNNVTLFPLRVWVCLGPLCDPNLGLDWLKKVICLVNFLCQPFDGTNEWPPPPAPVKPPVGPPALDFELAPVTSPAAVVPQPPQPTAPDNSRPSQSEDSADSSRPDATESMTSSPTSSSSCSRASVTICEEICSTVILSTSLSETCTQSCTTSTACSGTNLDTTSTIPCTDTVTFETLVCSLTTLSGAVSTACETTSAVTTGCQGNITSSFASCSLRQTPIDSDIQHTLASWAAQYPFNPAKLTETPISSVPQSLLTSTPASPAPTATTYAAPSSVYQACGSTTCTLESRPSMSSETSSTSLDPAILSAFQASLSAIALQSQESVLSASSRSVEQASIESMSTVSAELASSASASSASARSAALAVFSSAAASANAFILPYSMGMKSYDTHCVENRDDHKPDDWPEDSAYSWFDVTPDISRVISTFCGHIGRSGHLGSQYYVYNSIEMGHEIGTQFGRNVTFSVSWNLDSCQGIFSAGVWQYCADHLIKGHWWECPPDDPAAAGALTFTPWGQDMTDAGGKALAFCKDSFKQAVVNCGPRGSSKGGIKQSIGGWYFTPCLQWGVVSGKESPTEYWPLEGDGMDDMGWLVESMGD